MDLLQLVADLDELLDAEAVRDYCPNGLQVEGTNPPVFYMSDTFDRINIYRVRTSPTFGLDHLDRQLLTTIIDVYKGGPVGIEAVAATLGEETDTLVDVVEPFLLQIGLLQRTPRGRLVTPSAYRHLGLDPASQGPSLFGEGD